MGTYATNILPNTSGLNLGAEGQRWDVFAQSLDVDSIISSSTNPATTGNWRLANADVINWRNTANSADYSLYLSDLSATVIADLLSYSGPGFLGSSFVSATASAADSGVLRLADTDVINFRNNANTANVQAVALDSSDRVVIGDTNGVVLQGDVLVGGRLVPYTINSQGLGTAITGNSSAQTVFTCSIPANSISTGGYLRVRIGANQSATSTTWILSLNGQQITSNALSSGNDMWDITIRANSSTTGSASGFLGSLSSFFVLNNALGSLAWASSQTLSLTFNVASPNTATPVLWLVEAVQS
jgi:hypothetical protein